MPGLCLSKDIDKSYSAIPCCQFGSLVSTPTQLFRFELPSHVEQGIELLADIFLNISPTPPESLFIFALQRISLSTDLPHKPAECLDIEALVSSSSSYL